MLILPQISPEHAVADYIEVTFRDQYISRRDMWQLGASLKGTAVYVGKRLDSPLSVRALVKSIHANGHHVRRKLAMYMNTYLIHP